MMIPLLKKRFGTIWFPLIWTLVIGILMCIPGSVLPSESKFSIPNFDKLVHAGLFGGFVFLWNLYLSNRGAGMARLLRWFFIIFILANMYGIGMEYVQKYWIPLRDFDLGDIIADMIGAGLGYGLSTLWLLPLQKEE